MNHKLPELHGEKILTKFPKITQSEDLILFDLYIIYITLTL